MSGKVWFITGASKGLGRAFAEYALENGIKVAATARDTSKFSELTKKYGDKIFAQTLDVTDRENIRAAVKTANDHFGQIDVLINNAGFDVVGPVEETTEEQERKLFETHYFGPVALIKEVLPQMRERKSGTIVNVSSVHGSRTSEGYGDYGASKMALEGMSEALRDEVEPHGIRVVLIKPGAFRTEILDPKQTLEETEDTGVYDKEIKEKHTKKHRVQPGDPQRAAEALGRILQEKNPPLRVLMGSDCYGRVTEALKNQLNDYETWRELACGTDYPEEGKGK
jgi:NAD(P)-dependent dehydrogenase (short-subunit alcohol dehydrogenase family)